MHLREPRQNGSLRQRDGFRLRIYFPKKLHENFDPLVHLSFSTEFATSRQSVERFWLRAKELHVGSVICDIVRMTRDFGVS